MSATSTHESTNESTAASGTSPRAASRSLRVRVATAAVAAVLLTVVAALVLAAAVGADPDFVGLQPGPVAVASVVGVLLGAALLVVLRRLGRPRLFVPLVAVGALLSLGGPLGLLGATQAEQPGVTDGAALALIPLHLLVAVVVAVVLPERSRRQVLR